MTDTVRTINASIVICNWRYATFKKVYPQGKNSMDRIVQAGCSLETMTCDKNGKHVIMKHDPVSNKIHEDVECIPIRISDSDEVNLICSDWCTSGSPLKELNYDSIPRWWPVDWIYKNPGELPDIIRIDLGKLSEEHMVLELTVIKKPTAEVMCTLFSDIFIEGIDDQNLISDRRIDTDKDKNDDIGDNYDVIGENMFGKKKSKEETEVKSEVSKILEQSEQNNVATTSEIKLEEKNMPEETEKKIETVTEAPAEAPVKAKKTHKKVPLWAKITGGIFIVAAATTATVMVVNKLKTGGDSSKK